MNGWPEGWTDDSEPEGARVMPHVRRPANPGRPYGGGYGAQPPVPPQGSAARSPHAEPPLPPELSPRRGAAHGAVPRQAAGAGGATTYRAGRGGGRGGPGAPGGRPKNWRKRIGYGALTLVVVLLAVSVGTYFWADGKLKHTVDLASLPDRPAAGQGTNYLIVGSDSREGMTDAQKQALHTGSADGKRTDSMMILHVGDNGDTLLSLPRDSYVTIPAFTGSKGTHYPATRHKLNTAFAWGGGALLTRTVEYNTGLRIDHYAEIGFTGFVGLVDAMGGVDMCLDKPIKDTASGADLKAGCQTLSGAQSLAFVRERHQEADQDLGRMRHQQQFLSTLAHQAASPATVLNPFKLYPVLGAGLDTLEVDNDMSLWDLGEMFFSMKGVTGGGGKSMTVPIGNANLPTPSDGDAVTWDKAKSQQLFDQLKNDQAVTVSDK
ncbi:MULTISPECIES: LCP family protein [Streptomycetaceae]|uniref:LCP family protein n=1 Tax=Streptomycetaceae TaxID=2062 RepID=UPI0005A60E7C|nr:MULTISPECIES: LCP family protein [Streptomycetaceae]MYS59059.1 LytR family transcriptional regulator [Streptomyces sp. SID5468]